LVTTVRRFLPYRLLCYFLLISIGLLSTAGGGVAEAKTEYHKPFLIPVQQGIERGLESFLQRAFMDAKAEGADLVVLDINTPGGEVGAALDIGQLVREAPMHVVAYISSQAFSAGTYIALNADEIVMTPGSSIGAATPIDQRGNAAGLKLVSAWAEQMETAAKLRGRDPAIARAMVEVDSEITGLKKRGTVLSLGAEKAKNLGYADQIVANQAELYRYLGVNESQVQTIEPTMSEKVARFVTDPVVMSLLLLIGLLGIAIELIVPGFGIAGTIGVLAFILYFFGHFVAGFASWMDIALFVLGAILIVLEIFLPGGIVGALGFISMGSGLVLAAYDTAQGLTSLAIAALIALIVSVILAKFLGVRGVWSRFVLKDEQRNEQGYVAPKDQSALIGEEGVAVTPLRPAGIVKIDGKRVDAVSVGGFIAAGTPLVVVEVEGARVVVAEKEVKE